MFTLFFALMSGALAQDAPPVCDTLEAPPQAFQVAWISPVRERARSSDTLEVVRVGDLRAWIRDESADQIRLLQGLGLVRTRAGRKAEKQWKITIFDVNIDQLCRPVEGAAPYSVVDGVSACEENLRTRSEGRSDGCGYSLDTAVDGRGLDTFRISWEQAATQGFCVFPLERFIEGA